MYYWKTTVTLKFDSWKSFVGSIRDIMSKAFINPILLLGFIAITIFILSVIVAYEFFFNHKRELLVQIVAEAFGIVLDIGVLGILMIWITTVNDKKRKVQEAVKEIDDLRFWGSDRKGGEVEMGKSVFLDKSLEIAEVTLRSWQISYAALKIVKNAKTLAQAGIQPIDLNHCQVPSSNLSEIDLTRSNLDKANMSGCNLSNSNLTNASACASNFRLADLSFAKLRSIRANGSDFTNAILLNADCNDGRFINSCFIGAQLNDASFVKANLKAADFTDAQLVGVDFTGAIGLTARQLNRAKYLIRCILPNELEREMDLLKKQTNSETTSPPRVQFQEQMKAG